MINYMRIHNVDLVDGDDGGFDVYADDLAFYFPERYSEFLTDDEFFDLSREYLERFVEDVESTDFAKIDYFSRRPKFSEN